MPLLWLFFVVCLALTIASIMNANGKGIALWGGLGGVTFIIAIVASGMSAGQSGGGNHHNPSWDRKAVASPRKAERLAGGFDSGQRSLYRRGLMHIANTHQKVGSYTIAGVIAMEQSLDDQRREQARAAAEKRQAQAQAAADERKREEEAHIFHGNPDCLVLDNRTLHAESGDYTWYIEGTVTNRCDHDLGYAQVEFNFYDTDGNQTGSGMDNINNLAAGQTWSFKKSVYETEGAGKWKVSGLSGF